VRALRTQSFIRHSLRFFTDRVEELYRVFKRRQEA